MAIGSYINNPAQARSGDLGANVVGTAEIASGSVGATDIGDGAVQSGHVASGQLTSFHHASGAITSGLHADNSVTSGNVASGQIGDKHLAANAILSGHLASGALGMGFGASWPVITEEIISGIRAVQISPSGNLRVAMASISGRMPAIGVVPSNVLSGIAANCFMFGGIQFTSGMADFSGSIGKPVWVGRSGQLVTMSGSFNSGGHNLASGGDFIQRMGIILNSGAMVVVPDTTTLQQQLLGVLDLVDVVNRGFGL